MKLTKNLSLEEYIPDYIINKYAHKSIRLIDQRVIDIDQALRDRFGPMYINIPGLQHSGFRPYSYYLKRGKIFSQSQHKYGRASDKHFKNASVDEVYKDILKHQGYWYGLGMTTMENIAFTHKNKATTGWLHTDCRYPEERYVGKIRIVNP